MQIVLFIIMFFILISPFIILFKWINKTFLKKDKYLQRNKIVNYSSNDFDKKIEYTFMNDYRMWKNLTNEEKESRMKDLEVIFQVGKEHIKKEMITQGFLPGSKIIDIKYFCGLSEHGFTIAGFLIQNENGGEIRELVLDIDLAKMNFRTSRNIYHSSGKEKYYYLKNDNSLVKI